MAIDFKDSETCARDRSPISSPVLFAETSYNWVDITDEFKEAIKDLELGELLHDELFGLFEAMSAIEMMDPKMDAGMRCNRGNKPPLTFHQAIERNILPLHNIPLKDQLAVMDNTWACMVSWLDGHSLAQTVFTNLYLHSPHSIQDKALRAFCIAIFKIIDIIKDFINRGLVFEEEDFQPLMYGYRLMPDVTDARTIGMLKEIEDEMSRKQVKPNSNSVQDAEITAIFLRLKFIRSVLQAFVILNKKEVTPNTVVESTKLLSLCSELIPYIIKAISLGIPEEGKPVMGFDPMVNQRLLPPTFPRYTHIKTPTEAYKRLDELFNRLKQVTKVCSLTSFHSALESMLELSCTKPCIVSRSVMQLLYLPQCSRNGDSINCVEVLRDAAKTFISPPVLMPRSQLLTNPQAKEYVDCFLNNCVRPFSNLIQLCGHNRARQRDKLGHLLEEFANLEDEAERVDVFLHNLSRKNENGRPHLACFGTWVLYHTLRIMIMYLLSGFELELYCTHEYHYIYWYLYEFLYGWLVSALTRADSFLNEQELAAAAALEHNKKTKRTKAKQKKRPRPYVKEITLYQALQNMCGGYFKAMLAFRRDGKLRLPHPEFDCERVRYEHRFAPFNVLLTPPPVPHNEFIELTAPMAETDSLAQFLAGCKHFHQARTLLETITTYNHEVPDLLRVAKTNFVVLKLLATGHKRDSMKPPEFDFSVHHHFPIIKI